MRDLDYTQIVRRIWQIYMVLLVAGTIAFAAQGNRRNAASFLAGALASGLSFFLLKRMVDDLGGAMLGGKPRTAGMVLHCLRLVLLGGALFVILKVYGASPNAVAAGVLVPIASGIIEALHEWIYARA